MAKWNPANSITLVTGASSGIGWHLARQLCRRGATVFTTARRGERLSELRKEAEGSSGTMIDVPGDITEHEFREQLVQKIQAEFGRLDLLVNNAGIGGIGPFADATPERLRQIMEVNFFAPVELTRLCLPMLRDANSSVICNVSSVLGHRAVPDKSEYSASKFAIHGWSDALRAELAHSGIHVCLVSPSTTSSEFFESVVDTSEQHSQRGRKGDAPQRVAQAALRAIEKRRDEVVLSWGGKSLVYLDRICPWLMNRILERFATRVDD